MSVVRLSFFVVRYFLLIFIFHVSFFTSSGQTLPAGSLKYPWAGGMNSCQFGMIDLDLDGSEDLVIFDRHGNRIMPFLYDGSGGISGYSYQPGYAGSLPDLHDWVIFTDYDHDGRIDIFTYSLGGIRVFRNISEETLQFSLVTDLLKSYYYSGYVGILVTTVDYPALSDIDGDGDLDLLTFFGLGSYVEYHKNLSVEKYGNADSLDYKLTDHCWGNFKESEGSNRITLGVVCPYKYSGIPGMSCSERSPKHTGSTLLATDLDGNGLKDMVLGDVDFPDMISLINGGTVDSANMVSQDTAFPSNTVPVSLFSFPAASLLDIDHDGTREMVVSSFDPAYYVSENFRAAWYYENDGTDNFPVFRFINDRLFLYEMIDAGTAAAPVIFDITGDGLPDLIVGDYGYYDTSWYDQGYLHSKFRSKITFYRNTGSLQNPVFTLESDDFAGISALDITGVFPTFADLDGDGDTDMITGNSDGTLIFFRNIAEPGHLPVFDPPVIDFQGIDVGGFSAPQLYDLDGDLLTDLVIGEQGGNLNWYRNTGSAAEPLFTLVTDSLGKVNVTNYNLSYDGYSTPFFFTAPSGNTALLVGCEEGKVHGYTNIDQNLSGRFTENDDLLSQVTGTTLPSAWGWRTAAVAASLTDPGYSDLIVGNFSGGLNYSSHAKLPGVITTSGNRPHYAARKIRISPNPANRIANLEFPVSGEEDLHYVILNTTGIIVTEGTCLPHTYIDLSTLPSGVYMIVGCGSAGKLVVIH